MKLSLNHGAIARFDLEKGFQMAKDAGFDAIDFGLDGLCKDDNVLVVDGWRDYVQNVRALADKIGLSINQTHAPFHWGARFDNEEFETIVIPRMIRCIEISAMLGAEVTVIHPLHHYVFKDHEEEIFEKNMVYYRRLIPYAKQYGVKIGVENMWQADVRRRWPSHDTCSRAEEFVRYIDTLNDDCIVACVDVGHIGLPQQDDEAWDVIRKLGHNRVKSLHIHDNDYRGDQHLLPYCGKLNWNEIAAALGEIDYDGDFTYETGFCMGNMDEEVAPIGLRYMADIGRFIMAKIDAARPQK